MATSNSAPPTSAGPSKQTLRLQKELNALIACQVPFLRDLNLKTVDGINHLTGIMIGPDGSAYEGGHFGFVITCPPQFPFKAPDFIFSTPICHPNVDTRTGTACHDPLIANWDPKMTLSELFTAMHGLLAQPNYESPLEGDTITDKSPENARQWTQKHAQPQTK